MSEPLRGRLLPQTAYDFWARDSRDHEDTPRRDTLVEAKRDRDAKRKSLKSWQKRCWEIMWEVNEKKVLRLLEASHER